MSKIMTLNDTTNDTKTSLIVTSKCYECKYCNKKFNYRQNKYQHEQKCKKYMNNNELDILKEESKIKELSLMLLKEEK